MAIYAELFDGSLLEFPDGTDQSVINRVAREETLKRQPAGPSGMVPAIKAGAESLMGELALLRGKVGLLSPEEAEQRYAERQMAARRAFTPTEKGWTEDFTGKFGELLGGSLPYMAAPLAAGAGIAALPITGTAATLGALGLAGAVSGAQFTGSNLARQMEAAKERGEAGTLEATSLPAAAGAAVPQAALDIIGFRATPLLRRLFSSVGKELTEDTAQSLINQSFGRIAADYTMATGKAMGVEGLTETAQQYLERLQAGLNIADDKAREEYLESFIGGAILGGAFGAPGRYFERQREIAKAEIATMAPGQREGETLTQTANRLSREIKSIDEILSPPAPEKQFADAKQLFEMASQPDGAAKLNAYAEQLRQQPQSPERDKAIADTLTLYTQLVTEEKARKTPEDKEYPHGKAEPAEPAPPAPYPSFNALMDMVRTSPDATQAVQRLDEYAAAVRNLPATTERADHLRSVAELRKIVKTEEAAREPAGGPEAFILKGADLREAGINRADPLYHQIVNKNVNNPEDYEYVLRRLENALDRPKLSPEKYASIEGLIDALEANLARIKGSGFYARPTVYEPSGAGAGVVSGDIGQPAAEGSEKPKRRRVVRTQAYVGPSVPGEEVKPAAIEEEVPSVEGPEPGLDATLDRPATQAIADLEKELRSAQRIRKPNLFSTLMGQLDVQEVKDIGTSGYVVERQFRPLIKSGGKGRILGDIVSDGTLDAFLPYDLRHDAPRFDALEASEFIKEKLRQRSHLSYETEQLLAQINLSINDLLPAMEAEEIENEIQRTLREINASFQEAAAEQRERVEEITVPPAEEPARGAERVAKPEKPAGLTPRQQKIEFGAATGAARAESLNARNNPKLLAAVKAGNIQGIIAALSNSKNRLIAFIGQRGMPAGVTVKIDNEAGEQYIGRSIITDLFTISYAKNLLALRDALPNNTPFESVRVLNEEGDLTQDLSKPSDLSFIKGIDGWWMWGYEPITGTEQQRLNHLKDWVDSEVQRVGEDRLKLNATASVVRTGIPGGSYDADTKVISLDEYWAKSEGVVGHEVVHAQTLAAIANPTAAQKPYVKQLEDLFDHVKKSVDEIKKTARFPDSYDFYGLSSLQEFIAEGMSNPQFQFVLNTIPYKQKTAWSSFVDSLAKLLGITDSTAFTELVSIYESLTQPKQSLRDVTKGVPEAKFKELEQRAKKPREEAAPAPEAEEDQAVTALKAQKALKASQLQGVLKKILGQYGLKDVELNLEEGMQNEGSYSGLLIKLALDNVDPVRVLRHESVHALKELGFFTPQQWKVLTDRANKEWIDTFLKNRNIDGLPLETGQQSRYDAYMDLYKGDEEAVMEEAIADAFAYFDSTKAPAGMMNAILNRMRNLFKAIQRAMNLGGYNTAEDVFGAIEKGRLKGVAPVSQAEAKASVKASLRSPLGLYSDLENKIEAVPSKAAPAAQWKAMINAMIQKGVKPEEIEWSGVNDWLDLQENKVTKDALLDYLKKNGVQVTEVQLGGPRRRGELRIEYSDPSDTWSVVDEEYNVLESGMPDQDAAEAVLDGLNQAKNIGTKYETYQLPGGNNYREVLLTLPIELDAKTKMLLDEERLLAVTPERQAKIDAAKKKAGIQFISRHWEQPNVLAHIRLNDRVDADGNKVLFVEEIQSDWGQEGKKEGFKGKTDAEQIYQDYLEDLQKRVAEDIKQTMINEGMAAEKATTLGQKMAAKMSDDPRKLAKYLDESDKQMALHQARIKERSAVPMAPFVTKTEGWLNLALKRIMIMAAEGGYDKVAFVNGAQSADRYDLSKQIEEVRYTRDYQTGKYAISFKSVGDKMFYGAGEFTAEKLPDVVGKEVAEKIVAEAEAASKRAPDADVEGRLSGIDLKVGGEGMKTFYDTIVPTAVKKLLPKVGGDQLGKVMIPGIRKTAVPMNSPQPGFDVTPEMKEKIAATGLPKFSLRTQTPEFKLWFGQSKIVDEEGQPKVMYHGTGKEYEILGTARRQAKAIFVTDDPKFAEQFAKDTFAKAAVEAAQGVGISPESYKRGVDRAIAAVRKDYGNRPEGKEMIAGIRLGYNDANAEAQEYMRNAFKGELPAGPNIIPVYVKADNPFDYENAEHVKQIKSLTATLSGVLEDSPIHLTMMDNIAKGNWEVIEKISVQDAIRTLGFDGFYVKEQGRKSLAVYEPNQLKSVFNDKPTTRPELRLSLRTMPTLATDVTTRVTQTIAPRIRPGYIERIQDAISPRGYSFFRKEFVNRYNALAEDDREVANQIRLMGGTEQLADVKAESAALSSDLGGGLAASAYGVHDRRGGYPVYKKRYLVEKDFLQLGTYNTKAAAEAAAQKYGAQVYEIGHTTISNEGDVEGLIAIFSPLMKYQKPAPGEPDVFSLYQFWADVKRASRYIQNQATGKYEEKLFNDPKDIKRAREIEQQYPEFKDIQEKWIKYNDKLVDFMRDTGVISAQGAIEMKDHGDYFPFYRHLGENDIQGPKLFSSISGVRAPKAAKGSEAQVTDFFETVVRNTQSAIQAGIKNIAARRATDQALRLKSVQRVQGVATGPAAYRVLEDGKEVYYEADDLMFVEALKSLNQTDIPGLGLVAFPAQLLRALITKEPAFMLANMMRDSVSAWQTSGVKITPIIATLKQFGKALAGTSPELDALLKGGVIGGYDYSSGVEKSAKQLEAEMRKQAKALTTVEKITAIPRGLWAALEKGSTASDAATRMEIYKKVLAETNNEAEALWQSLEVMNFNRKGRSPVIRILTAAVPFLNARIQGLDVLYRTGIRPGLAADSTEAEQQRFRTFWKRGVMMMGLAGLYWALTHDDDDYKKQEQETRDNYWLVPSLGVKIPIAFEVGFMFKVVPERLLQLAFGSDTGEDFLKSMGRQLHSTLGVGLPQIINPAVEVAANYSFFTQRPVVGQGLEGVAPQYQIGPNTSSMAAIIGKSLNISPTKLDHLFQGYFGTMGMYAVNLVDSFLDMNSEAPKASKRLEQLPVLKRFLVDPEARGLVTSYYEFKNSVDEVVRTSNFLQRSQDFQGYQDYLKDNVRMLSARDYVNDLEKTMKQFREMKNAIRISQMSAEAKRDALINIGRLEQNLTANIQFLKKNLK